MCGIVGFITNETSKAEKDRAKFLRQGLIIDTLRGDDSTGVFGVGHEPMYEDNSAYWFKKLGDGYSFVNSTEYWENFFDVSAYRACVGHNRAATMGKVNVDNAHPFQEGPITMVHNGTLHSTFTLPEPMSSILLADGSRVTVDSHAIAYNLSKYSVEEVVKGLNGAFTLVWHDARDDSVNIVRNSQRPMHLCKAKGEDTVYFMSEGQMLHMLMDRLKISGSQIIYPKEGQWLKFMPGEDVTTPEVQELALYVPPRHGGYSYRTDYGALRGWDDDPWNDDYSPGEVIPMGKPLTSDNKVFVGGRKKEVPMLLQERLLEEGYLTSDRCSFLTRFAEQRADGSWTVEGRINDHHDAILTGQSDSIFRILRNSITSPCCVRPLGVKETLSGEIIIIVKYVSGTFTRGGGKVEPDTDDKEDDSLTLLRQEESKVRGPHGSYITRDEFRRRTVEGCSICTRPIAVDEHNEILWSTDGREVVCQYCDEEGLIWRNIH